MKGKSEELENVEARCKQENDPDFERFPPNSIPSIIFVSVACLVIGAMVLGLVVGGLPGLFGSWALLIFGWFYIVPVSIFVVCLWMNWDVESPIREQAMEVFFVGLACGVTMTIIGIGEPTRLWTIAYFCGGFVSGVFGVVCVSKLQRKLRRLS